MTNFKIQTAEQFRATYPFGVEYIDHAIEGSPKMFDSFSERGFAELKADPQVEILLFWDNREE